MRNSKSLIVGNDNSLIVYRLDSASIAVQSQSHPFGHVVAMDCFDTEFSSNILAVTEKGFLIDFDVRSNRFSSLFAIDPLSHSRASGVVVSKDASAFAVSSIAGNITVFDNRFLKPLKVWSVSSGVISTISHSAEPECVWVATGSDTCLFNLTHGGDPKHTLCINQTASYPAVIPSLSASNPASFSHNDVPICRSIRADSTSRCILEFPGSKNLGWNVLTGHNDGTVRHWTPKGDQSGIAFPLQIDPPITNVFGNVIAQSSFKDTEIEESPAVSGRLSTVTEGHRDAVNSVCVASLQCDIVATAGRDGLIKLWK
jgi:WD40 repeat protein